MHSVSPSNNQSAPTEHSRAQRCRRAARRTDLVVSKKPTGYEVVPDEGGDAWLEGLSIGQLESWLEMYDPHFVADPAADPVGPVPVKDPVDEHEPPAWPSVEVVRARLDTWAEKGNATVSIRVLFPESMDHVDLILGDSDTRLANLDKHHDQVDEPAAPALAAADPVAASVGYDLGNDRPMTEDEALVIRAARIYGLEVGVGRGKREGEYSVRYESEAGHGWPDPWWTLEGLKSKMLEGLLAEVEPDDMCDDCRAAQEAS